MEPWFLVTEASAALMNLIKCPKMPGACSTRLDILYESERRIALMCFCLCEVIIV